MIEQGMCETVAVKHERIFDSLNQLDNTVQKVEYLLERIKSQPSAPCCDGDKNPPPSLANILNDTPDRIHGQCDRLDGLLKEITSELF